MEFYIKSIIKNKFNERTPYLTHSSKLHTIIYNLEYCVHLFFILSFFVYNETKRALQCSHRLQIVIRKFRAIYTILQPSLSSVHLAEIVIMKDLQHKLYYCVGPFCCFISSRKKTTGYYSVQLYVCFND